MKLTGTLFNKLSPTCMYIIEVLNEDLWALWKCSKFDLVYNRKAFFCRRREARTKKGINLHAAGFSVYFATSRKQYPINPSGLLQKFFLGASPGHGTRPGCICCFLDAEGGSRGKNIWLRGSRNGSLMNVSLGNGCSRVQFRISLRFGE